MADTDNGHKPDAEIMRMTERTETTDQMMHEHANGGGSPENKTGSPDRTK